MDGMIGSILLFAGNFAPRNWMLCAGQTLQIQSNTALFSILGTTYGGNGTTTFQLPNLIGRVPVGVGSAPLPPGVSTPYVLGQSGGNDNTALNISQLPAHIHANTVSAQALTVTSSIAIPSVSGSDANAAKPSNTAVPGKMTGTSMYSTATPDGNLKPFNVTATATPVVAITNAAVGQGLPFDNRQPFLAMNYIICANGIYPSRN
ncbi:MAG: phage tail collar domain-containing protein [Comamonadaceae bacterium]|nr:MAG: phage tail collar domain-containing protein [Comamonadaceae bacterium]